MEFESRIRDIIVETSDTKTLRLDRPADFTFIPGQFVNITLTTREDGRVRRAYSIASSPLESQIDLTVRQMPGGLVSRILTEDVAIGDRLNLRGPYGRFVLEDRKLIWIAGGSGIVPFRSMWRFIEETNSPADFTLLYVSKTLDQIIYRDELSALLQRGRRILHTLTQETPIGWKGFIGRINQPMLSATIPELNDRLFYICGPPAMCDDVARHLMDMGVLRLEIRTEKYD
jgi:glycine betaine catabolism B